MLIMIAALAKIEGNADLRRTSIGRRCTKWAAYLKEKGLDPENQLCTDDFAGHLAHNTNLSLKAIVALGGYAKLADMLGKKDEAAAYPQGGRGDGRRSGRQMAADGDHYKLDVRQGRHVEPEVQPGLGQAAGYNLFPKEVAAQGDRVLQDEAEQVRPAAGQPQGLHQAGLDRAGPRRWRTSEEDFQAIIAPRYDWLSETRAACR